VPTPPASAPIPPADPSAPSDQSPDQSSPPDKSPATAIEPVAATPSVAAKSSSSAAPSLSLDGLKSLVTNSHGLHPGDVRLIATLDTPLPGMDITPAASQATRGAVLVVVHLHHAPPREPRGDLQGKPDLKAEPIDEPMDTSDAKQQ
jgi:hypothetical protein